MKRVTDGLRNPAKIRAYVAAKFFGPNDDETLHWNRIEMYRDIDQWMSRLGPTDRLHAVEVSGESLVSRYEFATTTTLKYPDFDLCNPGTDLRKYDVVFCSEVLEHVRDPFAAFSTLGELCTPGGTIVVTVPFLVRIHAAPDDYWRFTESGLKVLAESSNLTVTHSSSWGNGACVRAMLYRWPKWNRMRSLRAEESLPVSVWIICAKPEA